MPLFFTYVMALGGFLLVIPGLMSPLGISFSSWWWVAGVFISVIGFFTIIGSLGNDDGGGYGEEDIKFLRRHSSAFFIADSVILLFGVALAIGFNSLSLTEGIRYALGVMAVFLAAGGPDSWADAIEADLSGGFC